MQVSFKNRDWPLITIALEKYLKGVQALLRTGEGLQLSLMEAQAAESRTELNRTWLAGITAAERGFVQKDQEIEGDQIPNLITALECYDSDLEKVATAQLKLVVEPEDTKEVRARVGSIINRLKGQDELPMADGVTIERVQE